MAVSDAAVSSEWKWVLKKWDRTKTPKLYAENRQKGGMRVPLLATTEPK